VPAVSGASDACVGRLLVEQFDTGSILIADDWRIE
jgi:hypothetical protein